MNVADKLSAHWTDEQLIGCLYDVVSGHDHLSNCSECRDRLAAMRDRRSLIDQAAGLATDPDFEFFARQRRRTYSLISDHANLSPWAFVTRWAPACAATVAIAGGLYLADNRLLQRPASSAPVEQIKLSDSQLASEVSRIAADSEPESTAPLQALFE